MNKGSFMSNNMDKLKEDYPEIYDCCVNLNDAVYDGNILSQKEQKLIAIALACASNNDIAIRKQMSNGIRSYGITKDEIMDALRVVLLMNGKPAFTKSVGILYSLFEE